MSRRDLIVRLAQEPIGRRWQVLGAMSTEERHALLLDWHGWAEAGQAPPQADWRVWLLRAGRGFGKTRTGAEWVCRMALANDDLRIALVAATLEEARRVMVEGESGLIKVAANAGVHQWHRSRDQFRFANGAVATLYSADTPEGLRGPQHHIAWCDELAKWRHGEAAWDNLMMGLRLGDRPQVVVTTTPRPVPLMRKIMALPGCVQTRGRTRDNRFLAPEVVASIEADYAGTRLGRQELDGELIEDHEGALWTRAMLDGCRSEEMPALVRVVVGVDPPAKR